MFLKILKLLAVAIERKIYAENTKYYAGAENNTYLTNAEEH